MSTPTLRLALVATLGLSATACGLFSAPKPPTYQGTFGRPVCDPPEGRSELYVIDGDDVDRMQLSAIGPNQRGVVVAYDCRSLRVLRGCHASATYQFVGAVASTRTKVFNSIIDVNANLPLHGAQFVARYGQGALLGAELTTAGEYLLGERGDSEPALHGNDDCFAATHVVDQMAVGAFAVGAAAGENGAAQANTPVGGGGVSGASLSLVYDRVGDRTTCGDQTYSFDPPPSCRVPLKLTLVPLTGGKLARQLAPPACPYGLVWHERDRSCGVPIPGVAHTCRFDPRDCEVNCDLGDAGSCNVAGFMAESGWQVGTVSVDRALGFYRRACDAGYARACTNLADLLAAEKHASAADLCALYSRACSTPGEGRACTGQADHCPKKAASIADVAAMGLRALSLPGLPIPGAVPGPLAPTTGPDPVLVRACKSRDRAACDRLRAAGTWR